MKPVRCSWVDMLKIRRDLAAANGHAKALQRVRCVSGSTLRDWTAASAVIDAVGSDARISALAVFQPSHATVLARHYRRRGPLSDAAADIALWVDRVEEEELTVAQLKQALIAPDAAEEFAGCTVDDLGKLTAAGQRFGCIYADPPWQYGNQTTRAATDNHYETMTLEEIAALPVPALAADKCHLHLWTTEGFLEDAIALLKGWGFERKSGFVWVKPQLGIGNYWRCSHEIMLLGVRGGLTFPPTNIKSWIEHERTKHSRKPEAVRTLVEKVSPGPRLELFGRKAVPGWVVWGNEIERGIFDDNIGAL